MTAPHERSAQEVLTARLRHLNPMVWRCYNPPSDARQEWERLRTRREWWCRGCGRAFHRTMRGQSRCADCLGWAERDVHCRRCGQTFHTQVRGHRTRRLCDPCRDAERNPVFFCMKCGAPHNRGNADYCRRCEGVHDA